MTEWKVIEKDGPPPPCIPVLVSIGPHGHVEIAWWNPRYETLPGCWCSSSNSGYLWDTRAWKPLPEGYKETK